MYCSFYSIYGNRVAIYKIEVIATLLGETDRLIVWASFLA
jgi:hypothetical protein